MTSGIICAFEGRLGNNAELRRVKNGELAMARFSLATEGKSEGEATWVRVALFGEEAEALAYRLIKGARVYVEGRLSLNLWTDKQGIQRAGLDVVAWTVQPLGQIGKRRPSKPKALREEGTQAWKPPAPEVRDFDDPLNF